MSKITVASVNKTLKGLGVEERLANGNGYFYFYGGTSGTWCSTSVYVNYADQLTLEQWVEEYLSLKNSSWTDDGSYGS